MQIYVVVTIFCFILHLALAEDYYPPHVEGDGIISKDVKCLVCQHTVREMQRAIKKIDPKKKVEVSGFRIDADGHSVSKTVQYIKSETYLTELMESICADKMGDYAKARYKTTGKLTVLKMMNDDGGMNPDMSAVTFVQDGDLNKSLEHYCLEILEDNEEAVLKLFMAEQTPDNLGYELCTIAAKYCNEDGRLDEEIYAEILARDDVQDRVEL